MTMALSIRDLIRRMSSLSVLTTKQHYLWDLLAGLGLAAACLAAAGELRRAGAGPDAGGRPGPET